MVTAFNASSLLPQSATNCFPGLRHQHPKIYLNATFSCFQWDVTINTYCAFRVRRNSHRNILIMTRYLTPSKIGLLVLIELYTDGIVSTSSTISILSFILAQLLPSSSVKQYGRASATPQYPVLDLEIFEILLKSHSAGGGHPGRTLWDHFLAKLWKIDSLDALHEFFARLNNLLAKSREDIKKDGEMGIPPPSGDMILLSRISPFGSFLRKAKIEFERLKFGDVLQLWTSFMRWRQPSKAYWARRGRGVGNWAGDKVLAEGEEEWGLDETETLAHIAYGGLEEDASGSVSTDDVEKLLEFHVEQMQSKFLHLLPECS